MHDATAPLLLTGDDLTAADLAAIARHDRAVAIAPQARERLAAGRRIVERAIAQDLPVYGLTRGLGPQVTHTLSREDMAAFSLRTLRGRAHGVGPRLPRDQARAVMAVRLNGLLKGGAGITPAVAELLAALLNRGLTPQIPSIGSIGASDLCLLAHLGLALIGEGEIGEGEIEAGGRVLPAAEALAAAGLAPAVLGPRDGLALCSASAFSAGLAALALHDAGALWRLAQLAAAAALEAFRGNLSPHDPAATAARPAPGQQEASAHLLTILAGSALEDTREARRLQDPLSLRTVGPLHGSLLAALRFLEPAVLAEVNGAGDNPLSVPESGDLIATANFHTPALALALETLAQAVAQAAGGAAGRTSRLLSPALSDLPHGLSPRGPGNAGLAPFLKTAQSLLQEIRHLAQPVPADLRPPGDGVEDESTTAPQAAKKLPEALWRLRLVLGVELIVAAQAMDLRDAAPAPVVAAAFAALREIVPPLDEDRPYGAELERLDAALLKDGRLLTRAGVPPLPDHA